MQVSGHRCRHLEVVACCGRVVCRCTRSHIKEQLHVVMTEVLVRNMIDGICRHELGLESLFSTLQANLDYDVITSGFTNDETQAVYGSEEQIALMKSIWDALQDENLNLEMIQAIDAQLGLLGIHALPVPVYLGTEALPGPLFFDLIVIIYRHWSRRWKDENAPSDDDDGDDADDSDMDEGEDEITAPTCRVTPMSAGADMRALLKGLRDCV